MIAPASADENSIISGWPRCSEIRNVVMTATSATPPASPSSPSIRFIALMTPTIQNIVNGRLDPAERDRLAERVGEHVDAEAQRDRAAPRPRTGPANFFQALAPRRSS